jgi:hypothetical protein
VVEAYLPFRNDDMTGAEDHRGPGSAGSGKGAGDGSGAVMYWLAGECRKDMS